MSNQKNYLVEYLESEDSDFSNPKYAYNATVNWMHALKKECADFDIKSLEDFYEKIKSDNNFSKNALVNLFSSINYLQSIRIFNSKNNAKYFNARLAIIGWYYSVFYAAKAMIQAFNKSEANNHKAVADIFHLLSEKNIVKYPFKYSLENLSEKNVESQIETLIDFEGGLKNLGLDLNSDNFPVKHKAIKKCIMSYFKGTAEHHRSLEESQVKRIDDFKALNVKNFRTKGARKLRDDRLRNKTICFMDQAFRFRGKANYRDTFYFFVNQNDTRLSEFFKDLEFVAHKFMLMASVFVSKRAGNDKWSQFIDSLNDEERKLINPEF
jgi:hypothetical protein